MNTPILKVETRTDLGKGPNANLRKTGKVPAVCYGRDKKSISLAVESEDLLDIIKGPLGLNALIKLDGTEDDRTVFIQDIQKHPVDRNIVHVDFIHVDPSLPVQRNVRIVIEGKPEGAKTGGILQVTRRELLVESLPANIPEKIVVEVTPLEVGQSIHVEDLELPEGVKTIYDKNFTICAVVAPVEEKEEVAEVAEEGIEAAAETPEGKKAEAGAEDKKPEASPEGSKDKSGN
jgi:large subunit ribosomal protein L25